MLVHEEGCLSHLIWWRLLVLAISWELMETFLSKLPRTVCSAKLYWSHYVSMLTVKVNAFRKLSDPFLFFPHSYLIHPSGPCLDNCFFFIQIKSRMGAQCQITLHVSDHCAYHSFKIVSWLVCFFLDCYLHLSTNSVALPTAVFSVSQHSTWQQPD